MLKLFNRLLIFVLLLSAAFYIALLNPEPAILRLTRSYTFQQGAGYLYIAVFLFGFLVASLGALILSLRAYLRERALIAKERQRENFYEQFVQGRALMASHEWVKAQALWEKILARDPDNTTARIQLSICTEANGDTEQALRVLDMARSQRAYNAELLFRAADLNVKLGNKTAAVDNLALLMSEKPSAHAARMASDLSEDLGRLEDALKYQEQVEPLAPRMAEQEKESKTRLQLKILMRDGGSDTQSKTEALQGFVKRHPNYIPALDELADLYLQSGSVDQAAQVMVKAAKISGNSARWNKIIEMWLSLKGTGGEAGRNNERAVAAARSATSDTKGIARVLSELSLAKTLLAVNKIDEAKAVLDKIEMLAQREGVTLSSQDYYSFLTLKGVCLSRSGEVRESAELWKTALHIDLPQKKGDLTRPENVSHIDLLSSPPSPTFSTP